MMGGTAYIVCITDLPISLSEARCGRCRDNMHPIWAPLEVGGVTGLYIHSNKRLNSNNDQYMYIRNNLFVNGIKIPVVY